MRYAARSQRSAPYPRLVADVGGTHARFGWVPHENSNVTDVRQFLCQEYPNLEAVLDRYLGERTGARPAACAISIATPVLGDLVSMTNRDWSFSIEALQSRLGVERLVVLNDFAALALSLPELSAEELTSIGAGSPQLGAPRALIGPGTGLGVAALVELQGVPWPLAGEGGHVSLSAADDREDRVLAALRRMFGHASAERALSGNGLVNLYRVECDLRGHPPRDLQPAEVTAYALDGSDAECGEAVELFFALLGSAAGNLALTFGARGGVYIGGGIVPRLGDWIDRSRFRERFESKGRFSKYLSTIPVWTIRAGPAPALRGANCALARE